MTIWHSHAHPSLALPLGKLSPKVTETAYYDHMAQSRLPPLALPSGELSPKVTERASRLPMYVFIRQLAKHISANALRFPYPYDIPRSRASPLALPLGELSPKVTERGSLPPLYVLVRS